MQHNSNTRPVKRQSDEFLLHKTATSFLTILQRVPEGRCSPLCEYCYCYIADMALLLLDKALCVFFTLVVLYGIYKIVRIPFDQD